MFKRFREKVAGIASKVKGAVKSFFGKKKNPAEEVKKAKGGRG